jgi:hypothetical protein
MGFRFRRSIKLLPGVRFNVGLKGASISLGGRGATTNLSSRGVRTTLGIPGTGLSWSTGPTGAARQPARVTKYDGYRPGSQAETRAILHDVAQAQVLAHEAERQRLLNCWRQMPDVPSIDAFRAECTPRASPPPESRPPPRDEAQERLALQKDVRAAVTREKGDPSRLWGVAATGVFFGGCLLLGQKSNLGCAAVVGSLLVWKTVPAILRRIQVRQAVDERIAVEWPAHDRELRGDHERYEDLVASWPELERVRVDGARRLLSGEPEAVDEAVSSALEALDYPFEAECKAALPDPSTACIVLNLPDFDDVIPEAKERALKSGDIKESRRPKHERNADFAHLSAGLALQVARTCCAAAPTLNRVQVAAFTQRRARGSGELRQVCLIEFDVTRCQISSWEQATVDPLWALRTSTSRFDLKDNDEFKAIDPPDWSTEGGDG